MPTSGDGPRKSGRSGRTVLVAGGGGFLGAQICAAFAARGWNVTSAGIGAPDGPPGAFNHHEGLISRDLLAAAAQAHGQPDLVVHAAGGASVGQSWESPRGDFDLSVGSTAEILDFIRHQTPRPGLVLISSAAVYGNAGSEPLREDAACLPMSPYGVHKRVCEELALAESRMTGIGLQIVRFFSLYGEGLKKQILWDILSRSSGQPDTLELWGDGEETRDFLHVDDAARLVCLAGETLQSGRARIFNGASGSPVLVRQLAIKLLESAGLTPALAFNGKHRSGDPRHLTAVISRAHNELGFVADVSLQDGLRRYADWFRQVYTSRV